MTAIDVYYDFRSPYAFFASQRIERATVRFPQDTVWRWHPVSIDVLLNLQAAREPWADYIDPLVPSKRAHFLADIRRCSAYYEIPLSPPKPPRQKSILALCVAALLDPKTEKRFRHLVFEAIWLKQQDISDPEVLAVCLMQAEGDGEVLRQAQLQRSKDMLADATRTAYADGIFGVPSFVYEGNVFFGNDRLEILAWEINGENKES